METPRIVMCCEPVLDLVFVVLQQSVVRWNWNGATKDAAFLWVWLEVAMHV